MTKTIGLKAGMRSGMVIGAIFAPFVLFGWAFSLSDPPPYEYLVGGAPCIALAGGVVGCLAGGCAGWTASLIRRPRVGGAIGGAVASCLVGCVVSLFLLYTRLSQEDRVPHSAELLRLVLVALLGFGPAWILAGAGFGAAVGHQLDGGKRSWLLRAFISGCVAGLGVAPILVAYLRLIALPLAARYGQWIR